MSSVPRDRCLHRAQTATARVSAQCAASRQRKWSSAARAGGDENAQHAGCRLRVCCGTGTGISRVLTCALRGRVLVVGGDFSDFLSISGIPTQAARPARVGQGCASGGASGGVDSAPSIAVHGSSAPVHSLGAHRAAAFPLAAPRALHKAPYARSMQRARGGSKSLQVSVGHTMEPRRPPASQHAPMIYGAAELGAEIEISDAPQLEVSPPISSVGSPASVGELGELLPVAANAGREVPGVVGRRRDLCTPTENAGDDAELATAAAAELMVGVAVAVPCGRVPGDGSRASGGSLDDSSDDAVGWAEEDENECAEDDVEGGGVGDEAVLQWGTSDDGDSSCGGDRDSITDGVGSGTTKELVASAIDSDSVAEVENTKKKKKKKKKKRKQRQAYSPAETPADIRAAGENDNLGQTSAQRRLREFSSRVAKAVQNSTLGGASADTAGSRRQQPAPAQEQEERPWRHHMGAVVTPDRASERDKAVEPEQQQISEAEQTAAVAAAASAAQTRVILARRKLLLDAATKGGELQRDAPRGHGSMGPPPGVVGLRASRGESGNRSLVRPSGLIVGTSAGASPLRRRPAKPSSSTDDMLRIRPVMSPASLERFQADQQEKAMARIKERKMQVEEEERKEAEAQEKARLERRKHALVQAAKAQRRAEIYALNAALRRAEFEKYKLHQERNRSGKKDQAAMHNAEDASAQPKDEALEQVSQDVGEAEAVAETPADPSFTALVADEAAMAEEVCEALEQVSQDVEEAEAVAETPADPSFTALVADEAAMAEEVVDEEMPRA